ncbi:MAG TPA: hypothetical protein VN541_19000 [Tepidisphaeraceae bacterium]|nr:hypothetical protein [Tepidisphaeraceae bacterium]
MSEKRRISWLAWISTFAALYGAYLLFVSTLARTELYVGLAAAAIGTLGAGVFGIIGTVKFGPSLRDLVEAWRIPWYMVEGTYEIFKALGIQLFTRGGAPSLVRAVAFNVGGDRPRDNACRTLAVFYTTLTPNFIVLGLARKQRLLLYHQILPGDVLQMTINLGADPNG